MRKLWALAVCATVTAVGLVAQSGAAEQSRACSLDDRGQIRPTDLRPGVRKTMLPVGAASSTVCRYNGANAFGGAPQFALLGVGVTGDSSQDRQAHR